MKLGGGGLGGLGGGLAREELTSTASTFTGDVDVYLVSRENRRHGDCVKDAVVPEGDFSCGVPRA